MTNMSAVALAEKRILAAVVAQAVKDACVAPILRGKVAVRPMPDALTALGFLFDQTIAGLDAYAAWLDFDPDRFRQKVLDACFASKVSSDLHLSDDQRRNFRVNYKLFQEMPAELRAELTAANEDA